MMYPFADYKTEAPLAWAENYPAIGAVGVGSETLQTHFNNGTPDSTDSYAYPPQQNNGYFPNQFQSEPHTVPQYYPQQQQQQQQQQMMQQQSQQQGYYNTDTYYQNNGINYYSEHSRSPEYYQQNVPQLQQQQHHQQQHQHQQQQQQFGYNSYQGVSSPGQWHQNVNNSFIDQHSQQQQQAQRPFIKTESTSTSTTTTTAATTSPSFSAVQAAKREMCSHAQSAEQLIDTGAYLDSSNSNANNNSSSSGSGNFFFENFPEMQQTSSTEFNVSQEQEPSAGRLPSMSHFGFSQDMSSYKMEPIGQQKTSGYGFQPDTKPVKNERITDHLKEKKKSRAAAKRLANRFNGMSEEEVAKRGLPDYLREGLDIVFIGINPSMFAAYTGKYYDGPGNHFWQALHLSGLLPELMSAQDDYKLLDLGIGFTNIVARTTKGLSDLSRAEIAEGAKILREKLVKFRPKIAVFNGKAIYEVYSGQKKFMFGRQPDPIIAPESGERTWLWVMPSSSARCAQLPRAIDKVPFFDALRKFRDHLAGKLPDLDIAEIVFANVTLRNATKKVKTEALDPFQQVYHPSPPPPPPQQPSNPFQVCRRGDPDKFVNYAKLEPVTDGRPAVVPASVGSVIESVIQKFSEDDDFDEDDEFDELDFRDEDSNGIGEMNFKKEDL